MEPTSPSVASASAKPNLVATGCEAFDVLMSGGPATGNVMLINGPPGCGRSNLLHRIASFAALKYGHEAVRFYTSEPSERGLATHARRVGLQTPVEGRPASLLLSELGGERPMLCLADVSTDFMRRVLTPSLEALDGLSRKVREASSCLLICAPDSSITRAIEHSVDALAIILRRESASDDGVHLRVLKNHHGPQRDGIVPLS